MRVTKIVVELETVMPLLGVYPDTKEGHREWVEPRKEDKANGGARPEEVVAAIRGEETEAIVDMPEEVRPVTCFLRHPQTGALSLFDYHVKGWFKHTANDRKDEMEVKAMRSKVNTHLFIIPRYVPLSRNGEVMMQPDSILTRPLRANTPRGQFTSLASSECLVPPVQIRFDIILMSNKEITAGNLQEMLEYGQYIGVGQFRGGSYGRFIVKRYEVQE